MAAVAGLVPAANRVDDAGFDPDSGRLLVAIKQNYLYRVMPDLASQGLVTKSGRGWHPSDDTEPVPE